MVSWRPFVTLILTPPCPASCLPARSSTLGPSPSFWTPSYIKWSPDVWPCLQLHSPPPLLPTSCSMHAQWASLINNTLPEFLWSDFLYFTFARITLAKVSSDSEPPTNKDHFPCLIPVDHSSTGPVINLIVSCWIHEIKDATLAFNSLTFLLSRNQQTDMSGSWPNLRAGNDLENASRTPHKLVGLVINLLLPSLLYLICLFCLFIWATFFLALLAVLETCCSGSCLFKAPYHSTYFKMFNLPWSSCNIIKKWELKNAEDERV